MRRDISYSHLRGRIATSRGGDLSLLCSAIGYESRILRITLPSEPLKITLRHQTETLSEVVISGDRIQRKPEGYIAQLAGDITTKGIDVGKTLTFLPGITRDQSGYKLNGLPIAQFYIDERKVSLTELESLPSDMVQSVEVSYIDRVGATKSGSVVHIRLKAPEDGGYYGHLSAQVVQRGKYFDGINPKSALNYKKGKTELFAYIGTGRSNDTNTQWDNLDSTSGEYLHVKTTQHGYGTYLLPEVNVNYNFTEEHRLGIVLSADIDRDKIDTEEESYSSKSPDTQLGRTEGDRSTNTLQGRLKYSFKPKSGKVDFDMWAELLSRDYKLDKRYTGDTGAGIGEENSDVRSRLWQVALQSSQNWSDHLSSDIALVWDGSWEDNRTGSSLYIDQERDTKAVIQSPYAIAGLYYRTGCFDFAGRLAYQGSFLSFKDQHSGKTGDHTTWGLEPDIRLSYYFDEGRTNMLSLNYQRSVSTFKYSWINEAKVWTDRYHYFMGNPDVKAPITNMITLNGSFKGSLLNGWIAYINDTNPVTYGYYTDPDDPRVTYIKPVNSESEWAWLAGIQSGYRFLPEWLSRISVQASFIKERGELPTGPINQLEKHWLLNWINIATLPKDWSFYLVLYWEPTYKTYNRELVQVYGFETEVTKKIKDNIQISLLASYGRLRETHTYMPNATLTYKNIIPIPALFLNFRWNFRGGKEVRVDRESTQKSYQFWTPQ